VKTTVILALVGALLGVVIASFVVPPALAWYTSPGGLPQGAQIQAVVQIPEVIRYATSRLIRGQMIGAGIGATNTRATRAAPLRLDFLPGPAVSSAYGHLPS